MRGSVTSAPSPLVASSSTSFSSPMIGFTNISSSYHNAEGPENNELLDNQHTYPSFATISSTESGLGSHPTFISIP
ncbi:hypothetical protein PVAP13_4KG071618 [Panicum virgatum]|uniref:Uncharacterized protein n=1 Tax=Panicum virgatum TaxID=38727 RepID=A0A8T0TBG9_PANVG|nr:hypothetical protein PVAP13_4KG071618 [Panicum virgatum]